MELPIIERPSFSFLSFSFSFCGPWPLGERKVSLDDSYSDLELGGVKPCSSSGPASLGTKSSTPSSRDSCPASGRAGGFGLEFSA